MEFIYLFLNMILISIILVELKILKKDLGNLGGVYGIIHVKSSKQYIGSSLNLYSRIMDHIKGRDSNLRLQRSIKKYGLNSFNIVIYYFHNDPAVLLTDIETAVCVRTLLSLFLNYLILKRKLALC